MTDRHEGDTLLRSQRQADLLRRLTAGDAANETGSTGQTSPSRSRTSVGLAASAVARSESRRLAAVPRCADLARRRDRHPPAAERRFGTLNAPQDRSRRPLRRRAGRHGRPPGTDAGAVDLPVDARRTTQRPAGNSRGPRPSLHLRTALPRRLDRGQAGAAPFVGRNRMFHHHEYHALVAGSGMLNG
jgi:hypothetical protein